MARKTHGFLASDTDAQTICHIQDGYYNEPRRRTIEPHAEDFVKVKRILELFATGDYSLTAIQRETIRVRLVGRESKKPLPLSSISNLLRCPFYYGVFLHKGELHQGVHVPMITKSVYDQIQAALVAAAKPRHHRDEKRLVFLNFATCASCGHCITGERHVKKSGLRFHYYRCTHKNKHQHCTNRSFIRAETFAEEVKRNNQLATLPEEWKERFLARVETWETETSTAMQDPIDRIKTELDALKSKIDRVNNGLADGSLDIGEFKGIKNPLVQRKVELEQQIVLLEKRKTNRLEPVRNWIYEANLPEKWASGEDWQEMKAHLRKIGSNRILDGNTLTVTFKKPWNYLAETTVAVRSTDDIFLRSSRWWRRWELNPRP